MTEKSRGCGRCGKTFAPRDIDTNFERGYGRVHSNHYVCMAYLIASELNAAAPRWLATETDEAAPWRPTTETPTDEGVGYELLVSVSWDGRGFLTSPDYYIPYDSGYIRGWRKRKATNDEQG